MFICFEMLSWSWSSPHQSAQPKILPMLHRLTCLYTVYLTLSIFLVKFPAMEVCGRVSRRKSLNRKAFSSLPLFACWQQKTVLTVHSHSLIRHLTTVPLFTVNETVCTMHKLNPLTPRTVCPSVNLAVNLLSLPLSTCLFDHPAIWQLFHLVSPSVRNVCVCKTIFLNTKLCSTTTALCSQPFSTELDLLPKHTACYNYILLFNIHVGQECLTRTFPWRMRTLPCIESLRTESCVAPNSSLLS